MLTGLPPFYDKNRQELYNNIKNLEIDFMNDDDLIERGVSNEGKDLLSKLLIKDPQLRLGGGERDAIEIKEHPWFGEKFINWDAIMNKTEKPPYVPNLQNEDDPDHFDEQFTKLDPEGSYNTRGLARKISEDQWSDFDLDAENEDEY